MTDPIPSSNSAPRPAPSRRWPAFAAIGGLAALSIAAALLYGSGAGGNAAVCPLSRPVADRIAPLAKGEVAALTVRREPGPLPDLKFNAPTGAAMTLADLKGKTVLLNLWATWCAPCKKEMPALDAAQGEFGSPTFEVVAINIDQRGGDRPEKFLEEAKVTRLARYADASARVFSDLKSAGKAFGMPTTILIGADGCEIANLAGPAEWASPDAFAVIRAAVGR